MFDLVTGKARRLPSHSTLPILLSTAAQALAATVALLIPALFVAERIPKVPTMLAFVAPPPPPAAPAAPLALRSAPAKTAARSQRVSPQETVTPAETPKTAAVEPSEPSLMDEGVAGGLDGGIEGGVAGGIVGGIVGGLPEPPPPPPPPADRQPIRIGGNIQAPALLHRVNPVYPPIAVSARLQGIVILEALVDRDGNVADVKVLRSAGAVLDTQAQIALKKWRYSPLVLNGVRERFVLTVILSFSVESGG
jgi:periplasmic protein TonB